jgi:hypothetical protein
MKQGADLLPPRSAPSRGWRVLPTGKIIVQYNVKFMEDIAIAVGCGSYSDNDEDEHIEAHHQAAEQYNRR